MMRAMLYQKMEDGISDEELDMIEGELGVFLSAIQYEKELRQEAYDTAGGHPADLNNARKVSTPEETFVEKLEI